MADYSLGTAHGTIQIDSDIKGIDQADQAMGRLNKSAQSTDQAMNTASRGMGVAGAAIAGGLGLAVKTSMDFEATLSGIRAVSGATAGEMDKIRDAALRIGADTSFSATQAAEAMAELSKAGVSTEDILGGVADATVALAAATGIDLPSAATYASDTMNMFNLNASDMDSIVNTLAQTANASSIDMNDMGQAMSQVGAVANLAGLSVEDTAKAIGQMGDAGIKGSDAGTSLKTMLMNLQPSTKAQADAMRELGIITEDGTNQFYNADGSLKSLRDIQQILKSSTEGLTDAQKQQKLETIFGTDAIRAAAVMADGGATAYDAFGKKMTETGTAAEQAKIRQDNLKGSIEQLKGSAETLAIGLGTALTPMIRGLADALTVVVNWFNQLTPTQQQWIAGILASAAALLLLTAGLLKIITMFRTFYTTLQTLRILSTATESGFIRMAATWIAATVRMIAQGAVWVAQTAAQVTAAAGRWLWMAGQATIHAATVAAQWAAAAVKTAASWAVMAAQATANAVRIAAAWVITNGVAMVTALASMAVAVATTVAGWIAMAIGAMANAVMIAAAWFIALGPIGWAIAALIAVIAFVIVFWDEIVAWFQKGAQLVSQWMTQAWQWVVGIWNQIVAAFQAAGQAIYNAVNQAMNWVISVWNSIINFLRQIPGWIAGVFAGAAGWLVNAGQNVLSGLINGISSAIGGVMNILSSVWRSITGAFGGAASWLTSAGYNLLVGLWNGIASGASWLYNKVMGWAQGLVNSVKSFFGIGSPSKLFADYGGWLSKGLAIGIDDSAYQAARAALSMAEEVAGSVSMTMGGPDAFWDGTALGGGNVPQSHEVEAHSAAQGAGESTAQKVINFITNNPVAERASDSEARRLRALSALGAF